MPDSIQNAPEIEAGLELFYIAYLDLQSTRVSGFALGQIPWTAVDAYARHYRIEGMQYELLQSYIRAMDIAFLDHKETERKRKAEQAQRANKHKPSRR